MKTMRTIPVGPKGQPALTVPELVLGCMRIDGLEPSAIDTLIGTAMDTGISFFDHADIYGSGRCEALFGASVKRLGLARDHMFIQSKAGIRPDKGMFDYSADHLLASVDAILARLGTDYLDVFLLHRPDALVEPDEVARAFDTLETAGKVRHFGVSNHSPTQIRLLQRSVRQPLLFNQLQLSIAFSPMIDAGLHVNNLDDFSADRDGGILDWCRLNDLTIQAWSPFQHGFFKGVFIDSEEFPALNTVLQDLAAKYHCSPTTIAVAWISRHPARIQTILGTTKADRIKEAALSQTFQISREEWYALYRAAGHFLP